MMKKGFILLIAFYALACSPKYYVPNTVNAPMIREKGETNITAAGRGGQYEFQVGYGVSNSIGIIANGSFYAPKNEDNGDGGSCNFFELGAGYFKPINDKFMFDVYGLIGAGKMENHFPSTVTANPLTSGKIDAKILRYGIQPGFAFTSKYFNASLNPRLVFLNYNNIEGSLIYNSTDELAYLNDNKNLILFEPALTLRGGLEKVKLQVQFGYSLNLSNQDFKQDKGWATVGLNFAFK